MVGRSITQMAFEIGTVDNESVGVYGARGVMDPSMPDSDLDGIDDGFEDRQRRTQSMGFNQAAIVKSYNDSTNSKIQHRPGHTGRQTVHDNLENYTNYEEMQNGTNPISNDTDRRLERRPLRCITKITMMTALATGWEYR